MQISPTDLVSKNTFFNFWDILTTSFDTDRRFGILLLDTLLNIAPFLEKSLGNFPNFIFCSFSYFLQQLWRQQSKTELSKKQKKRQSTRIESLTRRSRGAFWKPTFSRLLGSSSLLFDYFISMLICIQIYYNLDYFLFQKFNTTSKIGEHRSAKQIADGNVSWFKPEK